VLDRRLGIPITLSVVYLEVGRRIGLSLHGVAFPGHFLVKCVVRDGAIVLDLRQGAHR
jgi:regulator of sirC expression with transglutaminase-like and TPR domain